mgnify:CR=1 FL=1
MFPKASANHTCWVRDVPIVNLEVNLSKKSLSFLLRYFMDSLTASDSVLVSADFSILKMISAEFCMYSRVNHIYTYIGLESKYQLVNEIVRLPN